MSEANADKLRAALGYLDGNAMLNPKIGHMVHVEKKELDGHLAMTRKFARSILAELEQADKVVAERDALRKAASALITPEIAAYCNGALYPPSEGFSLPLGKLRRLYAALALSQEPQA